MTKKVPRSALRTENNGAGPSSPYSALAPLYDRIMAHVDYDRWGKYLLGLIARFAPNPGKVLELGCGTGNLTFRLSEGLAGAILATDGSDSMLAIAQSKVPDRLGLRFERVDFRRLELTETFDLVVLAYDGINYLLEQDAVATLVESVAALLNPGGLFLFDQSTPANSINNLPYFSDRWETEHASYARSSDYDPAHCLHMTRFDIRLGEKRMWEVHYQRAYRLPEMELILKLSSLRIEGCFDAFTLAPATGESERIQWALCKPRPAD